MPRNMWSISRGRSRSLRLAREEGERACTQTALSLLDRHVGHREETERGSTQTRLSLVDRSVGHNLCSNRDNPHRVSQKHSRPHHLRKRVLRLPPPQPQHRQQTQKLRIVSNHTHRLNSQRGHGHTPAHTLAGQIVQNNNKHHWGRRGWAAQGVVARSLLSVMTREHRPQ